MHNYAHLLLRVAVPRNPAFKHLPTLQNLLCRKHLMSWLLISCHERLPLPPLKCSLLSTYDVPLPVIRKSYRLFRSYPVSSQKDALTPHFDTTYLGSKSLRRYHPDGQAPQRSAPDEQHCAALLQWASGQAIGFTPGTASTLAAINCHARHSAATSIWQDLKKQDGTSSHYAHHGKHHSQ